MSTSRAAQVERSPTRILRDKGIDPSIKCTSTLVANYNAEEDANVRKAMRIWLDTHIKEFSKISTGSISRNTITEFMNLAETKVKQPADAELVRRVYTTLSEVVMTKEGCSVYFVLALEHVLSIIDKEILQGDANALIALANRLVEMTDPKKTALTRDTFEHHASCLHAFERVLMVLHDLEKGRSNNHIVKYFEDKTKKHLDSIISCQCYYPFAYQALLIKEHLNALVHRDIKSNLINAGRRAFYAVCGGLYIFQGVRELAVMKLDFNVMVSGLEKIQQAFKDVGWDTMPGVQEIVLAASETVRQEEFGIFQQCYDKYKTVSWLEGLKRSKQRAIRYALVSHLCLFCTKKHSASIQAPALELLVKLVSEDEGKQWRNDLRIFEAMIESLIAIGKQNQDYETHVVHAFSTIAKVQTGQHRKVIDECFKGMPFEEKIKCGYKPDNDDDTSRSLFFSTRQRLCLHRTASIYNRNQKALKEYYMDDSFAKVSLFSDKKDQRHISTFDFNLEQYEKVVVTRDRDDQSSIDKYNQVEDNLQRTMKVRKPINVKDLFRAHGTSAHRFQENAQRILAIGNPGTGKTSLSKRLCFDWATESWGSQFTHVYHLSIRSLSDNLIGQCGNLSSVILQLIYRESGTQDSNNALYAEIQDNLSEATTLLILDGYDEAGKMAMDMVSSTFTLNCSLLILSRPHNVSNIHPRVDIEVECLEFSHKHLEKFLCKELGSEDGNALLEFLNANLSIKDTCQVAMNAQIITRLWRSPYKEKFIQSTCANLSNFYSMISKYVWTRFRDKEDRFDMNKTFDSLELVAFESFKKGMVEIPEELIMDHAPDALKIFRDSGFLLFKEEGNVFQFAHLTFHEYFGGCHLAKLLKSIDDEERQEAVNFITEHKYIETSRVMLSFMTQQFCMRKDIRKTLEAFEDLMQVFNSVPLPTMSLQHLLLRMRTLNAFLSCKLDKLDVVQTNNNVMQIVHDAMDALKNWFGFEMGDETRKLVLCKNLDFLTPIVDELARMSNLFKQFPDLLKPVLLNAFVKSKRNDEHRRNIARVGRLNTQYACQCIVPILDDALDELLASLIELCAFIGPVCAEPALDHLKEQCEGRHRFNREMTTTLLVVYIDLFPWREDIRQLIIDASRDPNQWVPYNLMRGIQGIALTSETEVGTFIWNLLIEATKHNDTSVRREALYSCVQHYQTFARPIDEVIALVRKFALSSNNDDRKRVGDAIIDLIQRAPEKFEELLVLVKALCRDHNKDVRSLMVERLLDTTWSSGLGRENLFNMAIDLFKDGYLDAQLKLLPFIFSFDKKEDDGIDKVNQLIANCKDLDAAVQEKAISCSEANALLSKCTIEEIHDKFYDLPKGVQLEIVRQFDLREIESNKMMDAIARMGIHCMGYNAKFENSWSLLEKLSKTVLFSKITMEKLANVGYVAWNYIRSQPLSHLLEYYWSTTDVNIVRAIGEKLLFSSVIFERKGKTEMAITMRENGANVKQTAPVEIAQDLLSLCKGYLKEEYGLDFH